MKKQDVIAVISYLIGSNENKIPTPLTKQLLQFLSKSYHLTSNEEFTSLILRPSEEGELTVLMGQDNDIAGFSRTYKQATTVGKKIITCFTGHLYLNPNYHVPATVTCAGIKQAIQYKLDNPHEETIYIALANTPQAYEFLYELSDTLYPKPLQRVPDQILTILKAIKQTNGWIDTNNHPMIINSSLVPLRSQFKQDLEESNELTEFFLSTNPDYLQGNSLLVYLPLHLANISYGLNHQEPTLHSNQVPEELQHNPPNPSLPH
ncbi:hypothetical protein [Legionella waltersii]|uniref:Uncharacterized protein n=1 Tax=Legionella waltersii TaxID=66969 RepID=A0A0W1A4M4_9GAMM|nr:hypothetical protein [Legionella waltersii]KTD76293.1 hypothetical protein Lwal_2015 [Legionella waltersii]SNV13485.1 Uncharacterised protein [Legionella waltersii]